MMSQILSLAMIGIFSAISIPLSLCEMNMCFEGEYGCVLCLRRSYPPVHRGRIDIVDEIDRDGKDGPSCVDP